MKHLKRYLVFLLLAATSGGWGLAQAASSKPNIFDNAARPPAFPSDPRAKRDRFVRMHTEMLDAIKPRDFRPGFRPQIHLNLFDDADYTMVMERQENRPKGRAVFSGHLQGIPGSMAVLTHQKGLVTGLVFVPGQGTFKILPAPNGTHRIIEVDMDKGTCGDDPSHPDLADPKVAADIPQEGMPNLIPLNYPAGCTFALNPTVVNLAVVYTPAALSVMGSTEVIESLIDTVVFYNNMIYYNSGINAQMQLVYTGEVNYTESGTMYTDLPNMANGSIPAIQTIQSTYGAVLVNMLVAGTDPIMGLGDLPGNYAMEHVSFAEAMPHEMGHNMGCGHDTANGGPGVYPYASGNRFNSLGVQYRTIMAYAPGVYTPYFSSPSADYLGVATGVANSTDNVRTINTMAPYMVTTVPAGSGLVSPAVSMSSPSAGSVFTGPLTLALTASASDITGIAQVDFFVDSQYLGTSTSAPYTLNWPLPSSGSHFLTAHAFNDEGTATFSCPVSIYINNTLPSPWDGQDIGWLMQQTISPLELKYMGNLGSETYSGGVYTVNGAGDGFGVDLTGVELDSFHFTSQPSCGYTSLTARATGLQNGASYAEAGLMLRDNNTNDSPYFFVGWLNDGIPAIAYRTTQGGSTSAKGGTNPGIPVWFQVQRSGNSFTGLESTNGSSWTTIGTATINMSANAGIGFAVSSANNAALASATFDNVSLTISCVPPTPTFTLTPTITLTPTVTPTVTNTPTITLTPTVTLSPTFTTTPPTPTATCPAGTGPNLNWSTIAPMPGGLSSLAIGGVNGIMYAVGGFNSVFPGDDHSNLLYAYNPSTNTWATLASMPTERAELGVGVVNGILYAVGGYNGYTALSTVEAYDPSTNTWSTKASMPIAQAQFAVGVINGILYAVGGQNGSFVNSAAVQAYNPTTNTWSSEASLPTATADLAAGVINGILYAGGGYITTSSGTVVTNAFEAYDPSLNTWIAKAPLPMDIAGHGMGAISGILYVVGGGGDVIPYWNMVEAYDPSANSWSYKNSMPTIRSALAVGVVNGTIYAVGGENTTSNTLTTNEAATIACTAFTPTGTPTATNTNTPLGNPTATPTSTPTVTPTGTPTGTSTMTGTFTPSWTPTLSPTFTTTSTSTQQLDAPLSTVTPLPTNTPTLTATNSPTSTVTSTFTLTASVTSTPSPTLTGTPTSTVSITPTSTQTGTPTPTLTATITLTATTTPTFTSSFTPTLSPTVTSTATATPTATATSTASITSTPTNSATPVETGVVIGPPYPNPVIGSGPVSIQVQAPPGSEVAWSVFTTAFRKVWDPDPVPGNNPVLVWNLKDNWQNPVADGLYYIKVEITGPVKETKVLKVLLIR